MPYDLFGEIPVTEDDIYSWVAAVAPRWLSPERSYLHYVQSWDIAGKVRMAKLRGEFEAVTSRPLQPYHVRLAMASIV
jgi:hypothetical protein